MTVAGQAVCNLDMHDRNNITYQPVIPFDLLVDENKLSTLYKQQSEITLSSSFHLGNMLGYSLNEANMVTSAAYISQALQCGFTYVTTTSGKLVLDLPHTRSMLVLNPRDGNLNLPASLLKRIKELPRIFRNKVKKNLSLKLNSNFELALSKLRHHHGIECWIGTQLESVWKLMQKSTPPQLLIFELWYGDDMIAADFSHPTRNGKHLYVATRFFDRSRPDVKDLSAGFILALSECQYLREKGCKVWDLGGFNLNPLMSYKLSLTGLPYDRIGVLSVFQDTLENNRQVIEMEIDKKWTIGTIFENITLDNLLKS